MIPWQEGDVLTNGIRLHYYRSGGDKPPVILAHGITDSGLCWPLVSAALAPAYDVITVDARGHGKSEKPEKGYSREHHARDIAGLIDALDLNRPAVMGHSMGAGTGSVLAATYPHLVAALILEDPPWRKADGSIPPEEHAASWSQLIEERKKLSRDELLDQGREDNPAWPEEAYEPWIEAKYEVAPEVTGYILESDLNWAGVAEGIQCPTLLITGDPELGAIVTEAVASEVRRANPRIEMVHIPGAGHNIRREQLAAYLAAVHEFLERWYPTG